MQECSVEILPLEWRHAAILTSLTVEHGVESDNASSKDGTSNEQLLQFRAAVGCCLILVSALVNEAGHERGVCRILGPRSCRR